MRCLKDCLCLILLSFAAFGSCSQFEPTNLPYTPSLQHSSDTVSPEVKDHSSTDSYTKFFAISHIMEANWHMAERVCVFNNMRLAAVENQQEKEQLEKLIKNHPGLHQVWIGAADLARENSFYWIASNVEVVGSPKVNGKIGRCVLANAFGSWLRADCAEQHYFACQTLAPKNTMNVFNKTVHLDQAGALILPTVSSSAQPKQSAQTKRVKKIFFIDNEKEGNWSQAESWCVSKNMHLASITNQQENEDLFQLKTSKGAGDMWIGGYNYTSSGEFRWVANGSPMSFTNFSNWNYNNPTIQVGECVLFGYSGHWWDRDCDLSYGFACEAYVE